MRSVRIAELKSRLSAYLRAMRTGETITALDRETAVARISAAPRKGMRIRKPARRPPQPNRVPLAEPWKLKMDVVDLLLEERQGRR